MPKLSEAELLARDAERDLGAELLESLREMKAGKVGRVSVVTRDGRVIDSPVAKARVVSKLSQAQFAALIEIVSAYGAKHNVGWSEKYDDIY